MSKTSFIIRQANEVDLQRMQTLFVDSVKSICSKDYNHDQINAWISGIENKDRWAQIIQKQFTLIAENSNILLGFASVANQNYIDLLYVDKDFQNLGVAKTLYLEILSEAIKEKQTKLISDVSITALSFFKRLGFEVKIEQRNFRMGIELINYKMEKNIA